MTKIFLPLLLLALSYAQRPVAMPDVNLQPQDGAYMINAQPFNYNALDMLKEQEVLIYYSADTSFAKDVALFGLATDALHQTLPNLVRTGGTPATICIDMYSLLAVNIKATQELNTKFNAMQMQINGFDERMRTLRTEMEQLKGLVSQSSQDSRVLETTLDKVGQMELKLQELEQKLAAMTKN